MAGLLPRLQVQVGAAHPFTLLATEADRWAEEVPRRFTAAGSPFDGRSSRSRSTSTGRSIGRRPTS